MFVIVEIDVTKNKKIVGIFGLIFIILPIIILLVVLSIGLTLVRNVLHMFGWGRGQQNYGKKVDDGNGRQSQNDGSSRQKTSKSKKVIADDEGEYVDFEEV